MDVSTLPEDETIRGVLAEMFAETADVQFKLLMFNWLSKPEAEEVLCAIPSLPSTVAQREWSRLCTSPLPLERCEVSVRRRREA